MVTTYIHKFFWFSGLALLQVLILNNVHIGGYATPFLYVYFILKFESGVSRNELMLWGFLLGFVIDTFSNTPGMNAAAAVLLAFVRPLFLGLFAPRDGLENVSPSFKSMGNSSFIKYLIACVFIHHMALLTIEFFSFTSASALLLRMVFSTLLTVTCIMAVEGVKK